MNRWRFTNSAGQVLAEVESDGVPMFEPSRPPGVMPAVVLNQWTNGMIGGASWCVACPDAGAASAACCCHETWLALNAEERDRAIGHVRVPPPEGRRRLAALAFHLRLRKRIHEHA